MSNAINPSEPGPILIIGAGVSGLAFAQGLKKEGIPFELYERDDSLTARAQGYRFRISEDGLDALRHNLTREHFEKFEHSCCSTSGNAAPALLDPATAAPPSVIPEFGGKSRPKAASVDRTALRSVLMEGIEQHVHLGKGFASYRDTEEGVVLSFTDGTEVTGVALVGADGTWSKVRRQLLPDHRLSDTQGRLVFGKTDIGDALLSELVPACAKGPSMLLGRDRKFLLEAMYFNKLVQHAPQDYVYWVLFSRSDEGILKGDPHVLSPDETMAFARKLTKAWHPSLRCLVDRANKGQVGLYSILTTQPSLRVQENVQSRVTLLGDAIHPMSPTAALGATTALRDTRVLLQCLKQSYRSDISGAFRAFESEMCAYANEAVKESAMGGKFFFGMRALEELPVL